MWPRNYFPKCLPLENPPPNWLKEKGLDQQSDDSEIEGICAEAIANDPDAAEKFRGG